MQVKQVRIFRQIGTNGIPAVHAKVFIHKSKAISGSIIMTHRRTRIRISEIRRMIILMRRLAMRSEAVLRACMGYNPGALIATKAMSELESKYPERITISAAKMKKTRA